MKIIITKDYEELSEKAAEVMLAVVKSNSNAVLGLATGTTPLGLYARLIEDQKRTAQITRTSAPSISTNTRACPLRTSRAMPISCVTTCLKA